MLKYKLHDDTHVLKCDESVSSECQFGKKLSTRPKRTQQHI